MYQVYKLIDPRTNKVMYVGCTKLKLSRRLTNHVADTKRFYDRKSQWVAELLEERMRPIIEIIEECNESNWREREKYWMLQFPDLLNSDNIKSNNAKKKPVIQLTMNGEYITTHESVRAAAQAVGLKSHNSILSVLNKSRNSAKGCLWEYDGQQKLF